MDPAWSSGARVMSRYSLASGELVVGVRLGGSPSLAASASGGGDASLIAASPVATA